MISRKNVPMVFKSLKSSMILSLVVLVLDIGVILGSKLFDYTPSIRDEAGNVIDGAIAELKMLRLNGRKQWI
ncbi:MAG TPA: hypothetical protein PLK86_02105, partial [Bacilli bacterium]|nr:hypothetical protein [Bacilli bacterium]